MAIDFTLREFFHPLSIVKLRRRFARDEWATPEALAHAQSRLLAATVRHASQQVPFYRRCFASAGVDPRQVRSISDLHVLPLLTREILRDAGRDLHAENASRFGPREHRTSGTTGQPLTFLLDRPSNTLEFVHYWRHWSWAGYRLGDRFAELASIHFLNRPQLTGVADHQRRYNRLMLNALTLTPDSAPSYARALRQFRPKYIKGLASALFHLSRLLIDRYPLEHPLRAVFSGGESLSSAMRQSIEQAFGAPVLDGYGHMERTAGIAQCPDGGYHVLDDYGALELLPLADAEAPVASPGIRPARAVGTSLYNRAMPLLRYDIGDQIEVFEDPAKRRCSCGRSYPLVHGIRGRSASIIETPDGRRISTLFLMPAMVPGVAMAQFVRHSQTRLEVRVVRGNGFDDASERTLHRFLAQSLGPTMNTDVRYLETADLHVDASGKRPTIINP